MMSSCLLRPMVASGFNRFVSPACACEACAIFSLIACRRTFSFPASTTIRLPLFVLQCRLPLTTS
jgi:hypothetical protein